MAKVKFSLVPNPTFKATVAIPVAGASPAKVEFTFLHRKKDDFTAFMEANKEGADLDVICGKPKPADGDTKVENADLGIAVNWDLEEPFNRENVETLLQNYSGAARAIVDTYIAEAGQVRLGNLGR